LTKLRLEFGFYTLDTALAKSPSAYEGKARINHRAKTRIGSESNLMLHCFRQQLPDQTLLMAIESRRLQHAPMILASETLSAAEIADIAGCSHKIDSERRMYKCPRRLPTPSRRSRWASAVPALLTKPYKLLEAGAHRLRRGGVCCKPCKQRCIQKFLRTRQNRDTAFRPLQAISNPTLHDTVSTGAARCFCNLTRNFAMCRIVICKVFFLPSLIYWSSNLSLTALAECFAASFHRLALITRSSDASLFFPAATASHVCSR
jgi:hypothetical protein